MISERTKGLFALHYIIQIALVSGLFWILFGCFSIFPPSGSPLQPDRYLVYSLLGGGALLLKGISTPTNKRDLLRLKVAERLNLSLIQTVWITGSIFLYLVASKDKAISRLFLFTWLASTLAVLAFLNQKTPFWLAAKLFYRSSSEKTILVYLGGDTDVLSSWIGRQHKLGMRTIGALTDCNLPNNLAMVPTLGTIDELGKVVKDAKPTQIIVSSIPSDKRYASQLADFCDSNGIRMVVMSDLDSTFQRSVTVIEDDGLRLLAFRGEPLENPFNRVQKRTLDILVSLGVVALVLPLATIFVWFFQRLQSPGPLFFRQKRAGLQNQIFEIIKFRSMTVNNNAESKQATKNDSRVYPAGLWFRKLSIDELPQFINVLKGEMSVVGPRPHLLEHNEQWAKVTSKYHLRVFAKPGITGLAQVRGFRGEAKNSEVLQGRVVSDIEYIENWSLVLDLLIITRTILQVFHPPTTAY